MMTAMRTLLATAVLSLAACSDGGGGGAASSAGFEVTNMYRAMDGKPPLVESATLVTYASAGASDDFVTSAHHHFGATQGGGIAFAENECPHWSLAGQGGGAMDALVAACIAAFYAEGPGTDYSQHGHYINMMGTYKTLGVGLFVQGDMVTVVEDFGN